ncbi:hypothetical protein [Pseudaminobacter soli (ex Li et al. 2025)]|uniref:hypothetical protein n=1 Tax=Pseudaminobacter soli (ex Li et al. 2025) TaxID=1295366 RepID=UPI0011B2814C|nr:hypothetical protein [Mesorhizobium soli]
MSNPAPTDGLCLDDLHVGQRFKSATHTIDEAQIKAFATQFDPQLFHTDEERATRAWPRADSPPPPLPRAYLPLAGGLIGRRRDHLASPDVAHHVLYVARAPILSGKPRTRGDCHECRK